MSQALYRKWRPKQWDEVVNQEHIIQTLRNAVTGGRVAHAYLFSGPRGTGKTSVARILAKAVNCLNEDLAARPCNACAHCEAVDGGHFLDLIEIDAASNTGVDDVRALREKINFSPNQGRYKVYIVDEVHMLSTAAFNALLKTLEEPPPHAIFILATTEIHKIPATVLSRCQRHEFRRLSVKDISAQLARVVKQEKLSAEPEALILIARQATGSMRDAISLLDQLASTGQEVKLDLAHSVLGIATGQVVLEIIESVMSRNAAGGLDAVQLALDGGTDARVLARQIVDYLRVLLLVKMGNEAGLESTPEARSQHKRHAEAFSVADLLRMIRVFNNAVVEVRSVWQPSLMLELALVESIESPSESPVEPSPGGGGTAARPAATAARKPSPSAKPVHPDRSAEAGDPELLARLSHAWKQIWQAVKPLNPTLAGLLNSCKLLGIHDGVLTLGFSEVLKPKAEKAEHVELTSRIIKDVLGVDLQVRCVLSNARQPTPPDVRQGGMVEAALDAGGEIVDVQE